MHRLFGWAFAALLCCACDPAGAQSVCRVTPTGTSAGSGADWVDPMNLQTALGATNCSEIWVAVGLYKPTTTTNRAVRFPIRANTAVYGGFAGTETAREQRNWQANRTVLSGDIDNNDVTDADGVVARSADQVGANAFNVVIMGRGPGVTTGNTILDGFTITGGNTTSSVPGEGGGLYCDGFFTGSVCSPTLVNLVFSGNRAFLGGAIGLNADNGGTASPTLRNIQFTGNSAFGGGALYTSARDGVCELLLESVTFRNNDAGKDGGAIYLLANTTLTLRGGSFVENTAVSEGGAIFTNGSGNNGATGFVDLRIANATFHANRVTGTASNTTFGGAISAANSRTTNPGTGILLFENVTFTDNRAAGDGKAVHIKTNSSDLSALTQTYRNVVIWGNGGGDPGPVITTTDSTWSIDRAIYQTSCPACTNTVNADPLLGPIGNNGGGIPTRLPAASSPAVDTGDNTVCAGPNVSNVDARGVVRPQGTQCDLGAVEVEGGGTPLPNPIFDNGFEPPQA